MAKMLGRQGLSIKEYNHDPGDIPNYKRISNRERLHFKKYIEEGLEDYYQDEDYNE